VGIRLVFNGIKSKVATKDFRPSIEDLKYQQQNKAEMEARNK
jgi:hypothetical protein